MDNIKLLFLAIAIAISITIFAIKKIRDDKELEQLSSDVLGQLGFQTWNIIPYCDAFVTVKSRQTLEKYDDIKFFKENKEALTSAEKSFSTKI